MTRALASSIACLPACLILRPGFKLHCKPFHASPTLVLVILALASAAPSPPHPQPPARPVTHLYLDWNAAPRPTGMPSPMKA